MKRVIALLLVFVMVVCMLASCDDTTAETHVHTYRDTLSTDAEGHWYDASCTCTDVEVKKSAHVDANNDGACDICAFTNHTHTYAEDWTADCTNHWHAANCGHTVTGVGIAAHADGDGDGKCDACAYVIEDIHVHLYDSAWTTDAEYHWHTSICEHGEEIADKAAHELDDAGYCKVCGDKVKKITMNANRIEAVLKAALARNHKVNGGKVQYVNTSYSWNEEANAIEPDYAINNLVTYTLGNGHSYINYITVFEDEAYSNQQWFELIDAETGEVFGVETLDGGVTLTPTVGDLNKLNGYNYMPSGLLQSFEDTSTLADTLFAIYTLSTQKSSAKDVSIKYDSAKKEFHISYNYLVVEEIEGTNMETGEPETVINTNYYTVDAVFTVTDDFVINEAQIIVDAYLDQEFDKDYNYDASKKKVTLLDTATPDRYAYKVSQLTGERTYTTAYPKAAMVPTSFGLYTEDGEKVGSKLTVDAGESVSLYLADFVPALATASFLNPDNILITVVNNDANNEYVPYVYYWDGEISVTANQAGSYTLTVSYNDLKFEVAITANAPAPESISIQVFSMVADFFGNENYEAAEASFAQIASGETLDFVLSVNPAQAAQELTYTVDSDKATIAPVTLENVVYDYELMETFEALQFSATEDGIYTITVTSTADATVTGELIVVVGELAGATDVTVDVDPYGMGFEMYAFFAPADGTYLFAPAEGTALMLEDEDMPGFPSYEKQVPAKVALAEGDCYVFYVVLTSWEVEQAGFSYVNLTPPTPESISTYVFSMNEEIYEATESTSAQIAFDGALDFIVKVNPAVVSQEVTYTVDSDKATVAPITLENVFCGDEFLESVEALQFSATEAGTYTITIKSVEDETVVAELTVVVDPAPWQGMNDYAAPTKGSGSEEDPFLIENAQHLAWLSRMVEDAALASEFSGKTEEARKVFASFYFRQTADIDLNNMEFMPIGSYMGASGGERHLFGGKYDGNGFKIMNAKVSMADHVGKDYYKNTVATTYAPPADPSVEGAVGHYDALFNVSAGAILQNITAVNVHTGNYDAEHTGSTAAGVICGFIIEAKILNCTTDETCTATAAHAAGMAVVTFGNGGTTVSGCTNNATITGSVKADAFLAYALYEADVVEECTDNGTVVAG